MDTQVDQEADPIREYSIQRNLNFKNLFLLRSAMTHRSYINENPGVLEDNERLEFLGDAVLDFLVASWLYEHFPDLNEGQMTRYRAALVGNEQLAEFARHLDIGSVLRMGKGEIENGGRDRLALLGSAFEALVGALYQDRGIEVVRKFVRPFLESVMNELIVDGRDVDAKSMLQEWAQAHKLGSPTYVTIDSVGPDHDKVFHVNVVISEEVYGQGEGKSKQQAAKAAARAALDAIENQENGKAC